MPSDAANRPYDPLQFEPKWTARWEADRLFDLDLDDVQSDEKFYNLVEFPYPSAEGLHVGHVYTYCGADTFGRYLRLRGRKVFQPIGFDSFGIHTENYALKINQHPAALTAKTIARYRETQLKRIGVAWDWSHEVTTSDPGYYRWTQWVFLQLFRAGLAEQRESDVFWCPSCLTVLANEQLEGDRCERCTSRVTSRSMNQWFLRITDYADALLDGLADLDWPDVAKRLQGEWIGRSEGADIDFEVVGTGETLTVFTTRPDTLFGATFVVIGLDGPLAERLVVDDRRPELERLRGEVAAISAVDRHQRTFVGMPTGRTCRHPVTGAEIPLLASDYVVGEYGTGAVMGVPAHDERDHAFAGAFGLDVIEVVTSPKGTVDAAWTGPGPLTNSGPYDGLPNDEAKAKIVADLEQAGRGRRVVRYRLRDWLISRQRYWGPPIPIIHCPACGPVGVPEDQLPVVLPYVEDFRPTGTGVSPLAAVDEFVNVDCPECGGAARRETDVSDTFLDSAWYFLRYPSAHHDDVPFDADRSRRLLPVDHYAGGREHVMRHHLYARFVTRALHDLGHLDFAEPFPHLRLHGLLIKDGAKMSKSRGNVVNPDDYLSKVGADVLRMYLLFCGRWEEGGDFRDSGLAGIERLLARIWRLVANDDPPAGSGVEDLRPIDVAVGRVSDDIEALKFNTAVSAIMEYVSWLVEQQPSFTAEQWAAALRTLVLLLAPFAPLHAEELWEALGEPYSVHQQRWPEYDPDAWRTETVTVVIQVNGRVRDHLVVARDSAEGDVVDQALERERVQAHMGERLLRRSVYVPNRVLNLVTT